MVTTIGFWAWTAGTLAIAPATGATTMTASKGRRFMRTDAIGEDMGDPLFREIASQPTDYAPFRESSAW
jgi:hypothetical protein